MSLSCSINGPINEVYPNPEEKDLSTVSHIQNGFKISVRKLPISKSDAIDEMHKKIGIPIPEMIFGDNMVAIEHLASGWRLEFNPEDALDLVDKTDKKMLRVAYSKEWSESRLDILLSWLNGDFAHNIQGENFRDD
jgi:type 2A phosphatase activator TIP41